MQTFSLKTASLLTSAVIIICSLYFSETVFAQDPAQNQQQSPPQTSSTGQPAEQGASWQTGTNESGIETLFGDKAPFVFVPMFKTTAMGPQTNNQSNWGTMLGVHGGAQVNKNLLVGLGTYWAFVGRTNMGYSGLFAEYRYMPHRLIHVGGSLLVGYGSANNYTNEAFFPFGFVENVVRLFNPRFFVVEPSLFGEINLNPNVSASAGVSYRLVTGLPESLTGSAYSLTNQNMSGLAVNIGLRFRVN